MCSDLECLIIFIEMNNLDLSDLSIEAGEDGHLFGAIQSADALRVGRRVKFEFLSECLIVVDIYGALEDNYDPKHINNIFVTCLS